MVLSFVLKGSWLGSLKVVCSPVIGKPVPPTKIIRTQQFSSLASVNSSVQSFSKTGPSQCQECLSAVPLHYDLVHHRDSRFLPPELPDLPTVLIHGLLGSRTNLRTLSKSLPFKTSILPDLRNHGLSPHCSNMGVDSMAQDVIMLLDKLDIEEANVIGHSLGGKVAMAAALLEPSRISCLGILDISPAYNWKQMEQDEIDSKGSTANPRREIHALLKLLHDTPLEKFTTRKEVELWIHENYNGTKPLSNSLLQFLLQNLSFVNKNEENTRNPPEASSGLRWYPNIPVLLHRFETDILHWPFGEDDNYAKGPVVFVKGSQSPWITESHIPIIKNYFPRATIRSVDGSTCKNSPAHFLHHEAPEEVRHPKTSVAAHIIDSWRTQF